MIKTKPELDAFVEEKFSRLRVEGGKVQLKDMATLAEDLTDTMFGLITDGADLSQYYTKSEVGDLDDFSSEINNGINTIQ